MNKYILSAIAGIATASIFLVGCKTPIVLNPNEQAAITAAAALGTAYDLSQRPDDLAYFVAAEQELYSIANSTNAVKVSSIEAALTAGGQTNKFVNSAIITGLSLADGFIAQNGSTNTYAVNEVSGWLADGIAQSVGTQLHALKAVKR